MARWDVGILIPAYQAERSVGEVVRRALREVGEVIVVDDGSTDATAESARSAGAAVLRHGVNRGKGAALRTGLREGARRGWGAAICMDADGQHAPEEAGRLLARFRGTRAEVVVGCRMHDPRGMPRNRLRTNRLMSRVVSRLARTSLRDTQSGFRCLKLPEAVELGMTSERYEIESELLIRAGRRGYRIEEVPVGTRYGDETSGIRPWIDTVRFLRLAARFL